ncbi:MAG: hypothetical protein IIA67_01520 [Planctomycetes bacterium]|nr:hypothetical protein [Planctomycetota bacterium]
MSTTQPPKAKRGWCQFSLRTLLIVMLLVAGTAYLTRPRYVNVEYMVDIVEDKRGPEKQNVVARVRVTNQSPNAIWYLGSSPIIPDVSTSEKIGKEWQWTGRGSAPTQWYKLSRGESFEFDVPVLPETSTLKIGIAFSTRADGSTVDTWSEEIEVVRPSETP